MPLTLFAENLLEDATVTAPVVDLTPLARLYDRDHAAQYEPGFPQAWTMADIAPLPLAAGAPAIASIDIDIDLGSNQSVTAWALVNHNITGVTATLFGDTTFPPTTERDSLDPIAPTFLRAFAGVAARYWRLRIPAMAIAPQIGELMLGVPHVVGSPTRNLSQEAQVGNVARDRTPFGHARATKLGPARERLDYEWADVARTNDRVTLRAVYAVCDEGAKALLVLDPFGVLRWMTIMDAELAGKIKSGRASTAAMTLEEVPL